VYPELISPRRSRLRRSGALWFADRGSVSIHLNEWGALENLEGRLIAPHGTPYGLREFVYVDPDGTAHRIGSPLAV
jgi:hypothetical protein